MAAPTKHAEAHNTANGSDAITVSGVTASDGDLVTLKAKHVVAVVPAIIVHNGGGASLVTEDETIGAGADGVIIYKDGVTVNRTTTALSSSGTAVLQTSAADPNDIGRRVTGHANIPAGSYVTAVSAGTSLTISANLTGNVASSTVLTLTSDVALDKTVGDATNGTTYFWSFKVITAQTMTLKVWWGGSAGARRYVFKSNTPPAGEVVPLRSARVIATWATTGGSGGTGDYNVTRDSGTTPNYPCLLEMAFSTGGTGTSGFVASLDGGSVKETASSGGDGDGRTYLYSNAASCFLDGYWDGTETGDGTTSAGGGAPPNGTIVVNFGSNPSAAKAMGGVLYAMATRVTASPTAASGTGTAYNALASVKTFPSNATGAGQAFDGSLHPPGSFFPGVAAGVGTAFNAMLQIKVFPSAAAGVGVANNAHMPPLATATETDEAIDPTVYKIFGPEIGYSDVAGGRPFAVIGAHADVSLSDAADSGDIRLTLKLAGVVVAVGAWQALTATPTAYTMTCAPTQGSGWSIKVEVRTTGQGDAIVTNMAPSWTFVALLATGAGQAFPPVVSVRQPASVASGAGVANNAALRAVTNAGLASGVGTAFDAKLAITVFPSVATGVGVALDPGVQAHGGNLNFPAGVASGVGTAFDAKVAIVVFPSLATGVGVANNATASTVITSSAAAGVAAGVGTAFDATLAIKVFPTSASGAGVANNPAAQTTVVAVAAAGVAAGVGTAFNASVRIRQPAGVALGVGRAFDTRGPVVSAALTVNGKGAALLSVRGKGAAQVAIGAKLQAEVLVE